MSKKKSKEETEVVPLPLVAVSLNPLVGSNDDTATLN
jgi:hypothetical protein